MSAQEGQSGHAVEIVGGPSLSHCGPRPPKGVSHARTPHLGDRTGGNSLF
jgi:hypothetical protein